MNALITSAGRRTTLLQAFQRAAHARGGKVYAGDMDGLAPALFLADESLRLPPVLSPDYIPFLLEAVAEREIKLIVPTIDTELPILAANAERFAAQGATALISSQELVAISGDKWLTMNEFQRRGVATPPSWLPETLTRADAPEWLCIKPRDGSASKNVHRVARNEIDSILPQVPNPILQTFIEGEEITIDALLDLEGRPIHYVPRARIRTLGGESIQGETLPPMELGTWIESVLNALAEMGARGPMTLQAFLTDGEPLLSEINPRFGGGFPLTLAAGGDYPEWICQMLEGRAVSPRLREYQAGLYMTRYYVERFTEAPLWR